MEADLRVALVQDALPFVGGAERVLEAVLEIFPNAPIYTLVFNSKAFEHTIFATKNIRTSFIDRLPGAHSHHRRYLPLFPMAIEQFDLREYDVILSFSYAVAHGVVPRPDQLHISLIYTPLRYAWHFHHQYLHENGSSARSGSWTIRFLLHYLRLWDWAAAERVDRFVAISQWIKRCIWRAYRRSARVIYPPVNLKLFRPLHPREDFYITVSRLAPHKKVDLIVKSFSRIGLPLVIVGDGREFNKLKREAASNIKFMGRLPDRDVQELLGKAKGFVHAAEEDFGITLVEAQAAGCPVITLGKGGALETVIPNKTGLFFHEQNTENLIDGIKRFEAMRPHINISDLRDNAARFSKQRFQSEFVDLVTSEWRSFTVREGGGEIEDTGGSTSRG